MNRFEAIPHVSLGPVRIGSERSAVHDALGVPESSFRKSPTASHPTDVWFQSSLQVFYSGEGKVDFIEVSGGNGIEVVCFGKPIFATDADSLIQALSEHANIHTDDEGHSFIGEELELSLWRPALEEPEGRYFATFGLGAVGYYA